MRGMLRKLFPGAATVSHEESCAFCGKEAGDAEILVAGPTASICEDCVGRCLGVVAEQHPEWREDQIRHLIELREPHGAS
jgi:ATP-dependent protease Clp ATPase subunit